MLAPLLLSLSVFATTPSTQIPSTQIVNGEPEPDFPAVVALGAGSGDYAFSACTGSVITPRIILSAGHCGADIPLETVVELGQAYFGEDVSDPDATVGFEDMAVHPDYEALESGIGGTDLGAYDVAVLVLEDDAPVTPVRLNPLEILDEDIGLEMISVGFGITSSSGSGGGSKRSAEMVLDDVDDMYLYSLSETNPDEGQICSGDSGGPQLAKLDDTDEWIQVAVHSWGDTSCRYESGSTRVDVAWDFIMEQVEAVHGTTDLCQINGRYEDGSCDAWCDAVDPDCVTEDAPVEDDAKACSAAAGSAGLLPLLPGLLGLARRRR